MVINEEFGYLGTEGVTVFPSTRRSQKSVDSRLLHEKNLVSIVNKLVDREGFIISKEQDLLDGDSVFIDPKKPIEINIFGYYFRIERMGDILNLDEVKSTSLELYAGIVLDSSTNYTELAGQDESEGGKWRYKGLFFTTSVPPQPAEGQIIKTLQLFERIEAKEGTWQPHKDSFIKFDRDSLEVIIDGGVIGKTE